MSAKDDGFDFQEELRPQHYRFRELADTYPRHFAEYIKLRVEGYHPMTCMRQVFGNCDDVGLRGMMIEGNPFVVAGIKKGLEAIKFGELWSPKVAVHEMLSMVRDPFVKDSTRFAAAKELNVMCGIVIVDENGKTRAGKTLDDFYSSVRGSLLSEAVEPK